MVKTRRANGQKTLFSCFQVKKNTNQTQIKKTKQTSKTSGDKSKPVKA